MNNIINLISNSNSNDRNRVEVLLTVIAHKLFFYAYLLDLFSLNLYSRQFDVRRANRFSLCLPFW